MNNSKLVIALDNLSVTESINAIKGLSSYVHAFKIGQDIITQGGAQKILEHADGLGVSIFYDAKFHDIPKTVELACESLAKYPAVSMITLHCQGGKEMLAAARRIIDSNLPKKKPLLLGVTVLTSSAGNGIDDEVIKLSVLAKESGMDGVVASAHEVTKIKKECGQDFLVITPGIRPVWASSDDQKRTATPKLAIENGADYLVVGRPIFSSKYKPIEAVKKIINEI